MRPISQKTYLVVYLGMQQNKLDVQDLIIACTED